MQNVFLSSFTVSFKQWRIAAIVYFIQLCLALTLGMQVFDVLKASIGHSLEINKLLAQYDHTVLTDFLKVHGASITPLIGQLRWLLLAWLVFSVFINAGLLYCASNETASIRSTGRSFWQGGAEYFFSFFKISLFFLLLALVWTTVIFLPIALFLEPSFEYFSSEQYSVWLVLLLFVLYLFGLFVLFVWSVICRLEKIKMGASIAACLKSGWKKFQSNKRSFLFLMASFMTLQLAMLAAYWLLEAHIGMTTPAGILILFLIQQIFVFFRIQIRQMMYSAFSYC